ncbi:hypothetical protein AUK11_02695 [bacterium CG2_30_37_16]|nr:MAG: hypothetical protein AUK11_02695 [bacterium CG2_30_37_16]PIP30950.1 MAG: hypothetical protein COX25_01945 [bacterium (Candidatus Howlettbacteria) CG23_combo_of_CG06-09_8_20_14_all_37_9]PIX98727.1 MAG: hypothetical protein COZ22_04280 [bacterium (Candidatus Howlettbacteria) CG_4_10_14_3_um_filter_37_10]
MCTSIDMWCNIYDFKSFLLNTATYLSLIILVFIVMYFFWKKRPKIKIAKFVLIYIAIVMVIRFFIIAAANIWNF